VALDVEIVTERDLPGWLADQLRLLLSAAAAWEPAAPRGQWILALRISSDAEISALHERFFDDASPTDVISFPSGDDLHAVSGYLGDIVVSADTAQLQAADAGHSLERELAFLALHGLLHVCGYDDCTPAERDAMLARQQALLERFEHEYGRRW
jgi:probable rRNA maturation factor